MASTGTVCGRTDLDVAASLDPTVARQVPTQRVPIIARRRRRAPIAHISGSRQSANPLNFNILSNFSLLSTFRQHIGCRARSSSLAGIFCSCRRNVEKLLRCKALSTPLLSDTTLLNILSSVSYRRLEGYGCVYLYDMKLCQYQLT